MASDAVAGDDLWIEVASPIVKDRHTLECSFEPSPMLQGVFDSCTFTATYDQVDITSVPEGILSIPLMANLAPVAWVWGAHVRVPCLDAAFYAALPPLMATYQRLFPEREWGGQIEATTLSEPKCDRSERRSGLLFSGGIDSLASFIAHRSEHPLLITIGGADLPAERSATLKAQSLRFAASFGAGVRFIGSNFRPFLNTKKLGGEWWGAYQHGLGLLGLCAPAAWVEGLTDLYIPSTHWLGADRVAKRQRQPTKDSGRVSDLPHPWGSHPEIDNRVAWSGTACCHDVYGLSRQEKIEQLARFLRTEAPDLLIRVCFELPVAENCSQCEKCCRTMLGLALAGIDPNRHGFRFGPETFENIRTAFAKGRFPQKGSYYWNDMRRRLPCREALDVEGLPDFLDWFAGLDI